MSDQVGNQNVGFLMTWLIYLLASKINCFIHKKIKGLVRCGIAKLKQPPALLLDIEPYIQTEAISRGYDSVIRRMQSWACLLYNLYNTHEFILSMTWCHVKNELVGVV